MPKKSDLHLSPELSEQVLEVAERVGITPDELANAVLRVGLEGLKADPDFLKTKEFEEKLVAEVERLRRR